MKTTNDSADSSVKRKLFSAYQAKGFSVIPVPFGTKAPRMKSWSRYCDQIPTKAEAQGWDLIHEKTNYGLALGKASGLVALDFDVDDLQVLKLCPSTPLIKKGKKGLTAIFRSNDQIKSQSIPGVLDVLSQGRVTIIPPSRHPDGIDYFWFKDSLESVRVDDIPEITSVQIFDLLEKVVALTGSAKIETGTRNASLFRSAVKLVNEGVSESEIKVRLNLINATHCIPPLATTELESVVKSAARYRKKAAFSEIIPLPEMEAATTHLDLDLVPSVLVPFIENQSRVLKVANELITFPLLSMFGAALSRNFRMDIYGDGSFYTHPNIWCMVIGSAGQRKSPALKVALKGISKYEADIQEKFRREVEEYAETIKKEKEEKKKKRSESEIAQEPTSTLKPPTRERFLVNDSTVEALQELMSKNTKGLLYFRDELAGLIQACEKQGQEQSRAFLLESWDGGGAFSVDRIGRGSIMIPVNRVTIVGGIQPDVLFDLFKPSFVKGLAGDGLLARFQLSVIVSNKGLKFSRTRTIEDKESKNAIETLLKNILKENLDLEGKNLFSFNGLHELAFSEEAGIHFHEWICDWEDWNKTIQNSALQALFAKYAKLLSSLCLIFHILDHSGTKIPKYIDLATLKRALKFLEYVKHQAEEIYSSRQSLDLRAAHLLLKKIRDGKLPIFGTARTVRRNEWSGLADIKVVISALETLADHGWVSTEERGRGVSYQINPEALK